MILRPRHIRRGAAVVSILTAVAVAVVTLCATVWIQYQVADRGYGTEIRRSLRKYGSPEAVPAESVAWLVRVHGRTTEQVRVDLGVAAEDPTALDPAYPLHEEPVGLVLLYLRLGFLRLWGALTGLGLLVAFPTVSALTKPRQAPRPQDRFQ